MKLERTIIIVIIIIIYIPYLIIHECFACIRSLYLYVRASFRSNVWPKVFGVSYRVRVTISPLVAGLTSDKVWCGSCSAVWTVTTQFHLNIWLCHRRRETLSEHIMRKVRAKVTHRTQNYFGIYRKLIRVIWSVNCKPISSVFVRSPWWMTKSHHLFEFWWSFVFFRYAHRFVHPFWMRFFFTITKRIVRQVINLFEWYRMATAAKAERSYNKNVKRVHRWIKIEMQKWKLINAIKWNVFCLVYDCEMELNTNEKKKHV